MRATAVLLSSNAVAFKYKVITHQGQQITQVSWTDASHQEVQASRWLSDLKTVHQLADGPSDDLDGEFDPGSGRTLAACLTHASRANEVPSGTDLAADG